MTSPGVNYLSVQDEHVTNYSINTSGSTFGGSHNSSDSSGSQDPPSATALHIGAVVMLLALLWGLFGNILTSFVILTNKDLKSTTNVFIVSLCINDILNLGINNMIVLISYFMMEWTMGLAICEMVMHFTVLLMGSSLWHTGLISIHRLIVVCFNNFYKKISKKAYTIFVLSFARIVPLMFMITPHLGRMSKLEPKLVRCIARKEFGVYTMLVSITLQMLPSIVLIICYIAIFIKVFRSSSVIRATRKREWFRREIQVTKMFGMVFLLIILGYLPYGIVRFIDRRLEFSADFYVGVTVLYAVANSCNPIIYGVMDRKIRRYCFRALGLENTCMKSDQQKKISLRVNGEADMATETVAITTPGKSVSPSNNVPAPCQGYEFFLDVEVPESFTWPRVSDGNNQDPTSGRDGLEGFAREAHHNMVFTQITDHAGRVLSPEDSGTSTPAASFIFAVSDMASVKRHLDAARQLDSSWESSVISTARRLQEEAQRHGDILLLELVDVYRNLPSKIALCHQWYADEVKAEFVMKTDDDCLVDLPEVVRHLPQSAAAIMAWWGNFRHYWVVERHGKWREESYSSSTYPAFACGSGSVVSGPVSAWIADNVDILQPLQGEDVSMGVWSAGLAVRHIQDDRWRCDMTCRKGMLALPELTPDLVTWHWNNSRFCSGPCEPC